MKKIIVLLFTCTAVAACHTMQETASTTPTTESPEESTWRTTCNKCHRLKDPKLHTPQEWIGVVNKMQHQDGEVQFTDDTKAQILKYLSANAAMNGTN